MIKKFICIHGHFYQPPRENAWMEEVEIQESAAPYHDWNERITHECYGPNGVARILNEKGKVVDIISNYARMSFNFGPTLLSWLEHKAPKVYQHILDADQESMVHFHGHGSAMAQVYNHIIMPLASRRDKETQVKWGIYDFQHRFKREPEGMWLAETAVDTETLEVLAENNIKFTVLAPHQAAEYRKIGSNDWNKGIDTHKSYICNLPSGKSIHLFFYDGENSQGVAFNGYLDNGKRFAESLLGAFEKNDTPQLVHIATDGESYGHHHRHGEMALAFCLHYIEDQPEVELSNYAYFLMKVPVAHEVKINENTSWSCAHGIERWRSNCGCHTGGEEHWNQKWRTGLRESLNWLRDRFAEIYEKEMFAFHNDPWELRNSSIELFFNRTDESIEHFFDSHFSKPITDELKTWVIRLLELQKQSNYMFTSCGWFFNDISGLETTQILQYASRGLQLAGEMSDLDLEKNFLEKLNKAQSNLEDHGTGKDIYTKWIIPKKLSLTQVGMHYAVDAIFDDHDRLITVLNYDCTSEVLERHKAGTIIMLSGITHVRSRVTLSQKRFSFAVLYMGNHHLIGGTSNNTDLDWFDEIKKHLKYKFDDVDMSGIIDCIKENFTSRTFSFFQLFKDYQAKLLSHVIDERLQYALNSYERIFDNSYGLLTFMHNNQLSVPGLLYNNIQAVFQYKLEEIFEGNGELIHINRLQRYVTEIDKWHADFNTSRISYLASRKITQLVLEYENIKDKVALFQNLTDTLQLLDSIRVYPAIDELQVLVFRLLNTQILKEEEKKKAGELASLVGLQFSATQMA